MVDVPPEKSTPDRCPGVLRPHRAADGALVRLRAPGGRLPDGGFHRLSLAAGQFGDGDIHLTSRGNLQIRGVSVDERGTVPRGLVRAVSDAGFLPSLSHERVRNIVASPLSGLGGGLADIRPLVGALDDALCAEPVLADLPGRFLFGLDDGRGDVAGLRCDLAAIAVDSRNARLIVGALSGTTVPLAHVVASLIDLALRFAEVRAGRWHVRQLPDAGREIGGGPAAPPVAGFEMPYGRLDSAVSVLVPLGILTPSMVSALPHRDVVVTPWRGLVLPASADPAALENAGFVLDGDSAWSRVTACTGAPGCNLAEGNTRALARRVAAAPFPNEPVHVVGCERSCGAPHSPHTLVFARSST
ncbi:cobalamin biosynthesis protein CobG [Rhodococcus chondri]|uniref:Cobalamin biosynthesis protein CobG n=1 Tax=Rhodococcus chondri TaxID=3065941 RepID=A0ABU7JSE8_9NOCA|nr:cobalamin biosynthesis protein CobG [Rhodococcus sp. CC-R104]MEE2032963.1 cobalamin biosynthesis protein CobG [Rhodococcus sp. CC-R104]